jgi:death on curing protein
VTVRYVTLREAFHVIAHTLHRDPFDVMRDTILLESALGRPLATIYGRDAYPDIYTKAAALLHSMLRNHPLLDGNKRSGWVLCVYFFDVNGYAQNYDEDEMFDFILDVAAGELRDVREIGERLARWFRPRAVS